jgi:proline dehydrogenase
VLRALLIYLSKAEWARRIVTKRRFARRAASRFISGETLSQAIAVIQELNRQGLYATLDHLGEHVSNPEEAERSKHAYLELLGEIEAEGIQASVSLKLTQLGLNIDPSLCQNHMREILQTASRWNNFVRIDMEDSPVIDLTIDLYNNLRKSGMENVGMVIQSYLYRSEEDTRSLLSTGSRIRLVKGAYREPPEIAYPRKRDVDRNFDLLTRIIIDAAIEQSSTPASEDGKLPPVTAIATHDEKRIDFAIEYAQRKGLPRKALEFQMLYGIRTQYQLSLAEQGYPVRVYVPYGTEWYPYYVRRLAERPANLWFFISNVFRQ